MAVNGLFCGVQGLKHVFGSAAEWVITGPGCFQGSGHLAMQRFFWRAQIRVCWPFCLSIRL